MVTKNSLTNNETGPKGDKSVTFLIEYPQIRCRTVMPDKLSLNIVQENPKNPVMIPKLSAL